MADPVGAVPAACAAGACALFMALVGVEPQSLVWGLVGAVFGVTFAPPSGRGRAVFLFLAVMLACALLGTWAADYWHGGSRVARNAWAMISAAVFHPALAAIVQSVPAIVQAVFRAKSGGQQ